MSAAPRRTAGGTETQPKRTAMVGSAQGSRLAIEENELFAWAAAKLGCRPSDITKGSREEQLDIHIQAPDGAVRKWRRPFRIRVVYSEANYGRPAEVKVMLHEGFSNQSKARTNLPADVATEIIGSRGWKVEQMGKKR